MDTQRRVKTNRLARQSRLVLPAGVSSPVRSFRAVGGDPVLIRRARGSRVYDCDGNGYIDFTLGWGSLILGHNYPAVNAAIRAAIRRGTYFGTTTAAEVELARLITQASSSVEQIRFVNSGTEAVMGALRLARGYTGREYVLKFEGAYHGHADYLLTKAGSGMATFGLPASAGVPEAFCRRTITIPREGALTHLQRIFRKQGNRIAAVIVEPVGGNDGVVPPDPQLLGEVRRLCSIHGSLLIADEVITGFRFHYGLYSDMAGVRPDIVCLGKLIGGGLPVGAYGGSRRIMARLAPEGDVYQASTFAGNPVVMSAGCAVLRALRDRRRHYQQLNARAARMVQSIRSASGAAGCAADVRVFGSMFSIRFGAKGAFAQFFNRLIAAGIYLAPSPYESHFLSFAHTEQDCDYTAACVRAALGRTR